MANTLTNILPRLLAQGLTVLREQAVMAQLVNADYSALAAQRGNVINVPIQSAIAARDVTAAVTYAANQDNAPTTVAVTLDFWKEATFHLSDADAVAVMDGVIPMQAGAAIKSLANAVDSYILGKHTGIFNLAGTPGTTPFNASLNMAASARFLLNRSLAPIDDRRAVIDPFADSNLLLNTQVLQFDQRGDTGGIIKGAIGTKLGFDWYMDQNVPSYTPGTAWVTGFSASTLSAAVGDSTMKITNTTASGTIKIGDIFTVGGSTRQYVVTVATTFSATVPSAITFVPALVTGVNTDIALTVVGTAYTVNLAFHRDAFAWASRPLADPFGAGSDFMAAADPISGIALRVEKSRQYKQTTFSYDIMGGANLVRPELACKIAGQ